MKRKEIYFTQHNYIGMGALICPKLRCMLFIIRLKELIILK